MKSAEEILHELDAIFDCANSQCERKDASERRISKLKKHELEIRKELNEFILDIAKLLPGSDGLGHDGLAWSIDDFKDAIQKVREDQTLICAEVIDFECKKETPKGTIYYVDIGHEKAHKAIMNTIKEGK